MNDDRRRLDDILVAVADAWVGVRSAGTVGGRSMVDSVNDHELFGLVDLVDDPICASSG